MGTDLKANRITRDDYAVQSHGINSMQKQSARWRRGRKKSRANQMRRRRGGFKKKKEVGGELFRMSVSWGAIKYRWFKGGKKQEGYGRMAPQGGRAILLEERVKMGERSKAGGSYGALGGKLLLRKGFAAGSRKLCAHYNHTKKKKILNDPGADREEKRRGYRKGG